MKRRGNRRYYQHHEVLLVRRIRRLLYDQGFTISGARNRLGETLHGGHGKDAVEAAVEIPVDTILEVSETDIRSVVAELRAALTLLTDPIGRGSGGKAGQR
jgi:DNA-binding transcriptional MerR regulator